MGRFQRMFINLSASLLWAAVVLMIVSNGATIVSFQFLDRTYPGVSLATVIGLVAVLVGVSLGLKLWEMVRRLKQASLKTERQVERAEVTAEISTDKVKALEAKIQTLETALAKAMSRKTDTSLVL